MNGKTLNISQNTLDQLLRASLIQQMFFTNNLKQPSFRFNLVPLALSNQIKSFVFNLSGQNFQISPGKQLIKTW